MKAHEVKVGDGFIASIWNEDWRKSFIPGKPLAGELLSVSIIVPGGGRDFLKSMLKAHCALPSIDDGQLDWRQAMWVAGLRDSRSIKVKVVDWNMPPDLKSEEALRLS